MKEQTWEDQAEGTAVVQAGGADGSGEEKRTNGLLRGTCWSTRWDTEMVLLSFEHNARHISATRKNYSCLLSLLTNSLFSHTKRIGLRRNLEPIQMIP